VSKKGMFFLHFIWNLQVSGVFEDAEIYSNFLLTCSYATREVLAKYAFWWIDLQKQGLELK